jgi:hypothetical protein
MNTLKIAIITVFALVIFNYSFEIEKIILTVDSSLKEWETTLF